MIYILDTSFFVDSHKLHFPLNANPDFWNLIQDLANRGIVTIPKKVYEELTSYTDELVDWVKANKSCLVDVDDKAFEKLHIVMGTGYGIIDENLLEKLGADPYVIAYALAVKGSVVTSEKIANKTNPANKKIPQICQILEIPCFTATRFIWEIRNYLPK